MKYHLQIPGKTFCFGEYAALVGGAAFLITTKPGFEVEFEATNEPQTCPFHPLSPAGRYYGNNENFFSSWKISFRDGYQGRGGFGASTAQFIGLAFFKRQTEAPDSMISQSLFYKSIWKEYQDVNKQLKPDLLSAQLPSGYDLWAQLIGSVSTIKRINNEGDSEFNHQRMMWPFPDLDFLIVPTGFKVATHDHLSELNPESLKSLSQVSDKMMASLHTKDSDGFIEGLRVWRERLSSLALIHPHTIDLLKKIDSYTQIAYAKGCGALGADILFVAFKQGERTAVRTILNEMNLNEVYDRHDLWDQDIRVQLC